MLKSALVGAAALIAMPALAQNTPASAQNPTQAAQSQKAVPQTDAQLVDPMTDTAAPSDATAQTPVQSADVEGAAATGDQVTQVVNAEFPTYDRNTDGSLDQAEFGAWMVKLKSASDPAIKAGDPATTKWVSSAFTQADTDQSAGVSKDELTAFLSTARRG